MITCRNLVKYYGDELAVDKLSFAIKEGEVFGLIGPNGAGKTTTIKMLLGLTSISAGNIELKEGIKIGYSPETPYFYPFLTAEETLKFYGQLEGIEPTKLKEEVNLILEKVGLKEAKDKRVEKFSKGMVQRLAIGQSLLGEPDFLVFDEPAAGLDAEGRIEIIELIQELQQEGKTILLNSHILQDIERVADRGIILKEGQVVRNWNFTEQIITLVIEANYNASILTALQEMASQVKEQKDGKLKVEVKTKREIASVVRLIVSGGGEVYEVKRTKNLEGIFLDSLGGDNYDFNYKKCN